MAKRKSADKENGKLKRKRYEKELRKLQVELCHLQEWVKAKRLKVIIVFEGRDTAGKGGTIKALTERVSPRVFRVVALPAPSERQKSQLYMQRYVEQFPAGGEIVIFDRSWYNRAGVERIMGFVDEKTSVFEASSVSMSSSRRSCSLPRTISRAAGMSRTRPALSSSARSGGMRAWRAASSARASAARAAVIRRRRMAIPATTSSWAARDAGGNGVGSKSTRRRSASSRRPIKRR